MLCDVRMPGFRGVDVVPRALAIDADLAIVMLTAVNDAPPRLKYCLPARWTT